MRTSLHIIMLVLACPFIGRAAPDCEHWILQEGVEQNAFEAFWRTATADDVARCLAAGAALDARGADGKTLLHHAAFLRNVEAVNALLDAGADPNVRDSRESTPLHGLVALNDIGDVVTVLLNAGADPDTCYSNGFSALHGAAIFGEVNTVIALLEAGADPDARDSRDGRTPLHWWAANWGNDPAKAIALLQGGADPNARDEERKTPLHHVALIGRHESRTRAVLALLRAGANPDARDENGEPALKLNADALRNIGWALYRGDGVPEDKTEAVKWYHLAADQGDADAQDRLGDMYYLGDGVAKDVAEAVKWYRLAAEQGNADAQNSLGFMYDSGHGVPEDDAEAVKWYSRAAEQGNRLAQGNLGVMYQWGHGVPEDDAEAVKWYRRAADQGNAFGQYSLGVMYQWGEGVPEDYLEAYARINIAGALGSDVAEHKQKLAAQMTKEDIAAAQGRSREIWQALGESN